MKHRSHWSALIVAYHLFYCIFSFLHHLLCIVSSLALEIFNSTYKIQEGLDFIAWCVVALWIDFIPVVNVGPNARFHCYFAVKTVGTSAIMISLVNCSIKYISVLTNSNQILWLHHLHLLNLFKIMSEKYNQVLLALCILVQTVWSLRQVLSRNCVVSMPVMVLLTVWLNLSFLCFSYQ